MAASHRTSSFISRVVSTAPSTPFVCKTCRSKLLPPSATQIRHASNRDPNLPFTEKLRRKIWGTDNPPGLADPYGGPGMFERRRIEQDRRAAKERAERELDREIEEADRGVVNGRMGELEEARREEMRVSPRDVEEDNDEEVVEAPDNKEYQPAKSWDGLVHIGHTGHWSEDQPTDAEDYRAWNEADEAIAAPTTRDETIKVLLEAVSEAQGAEIDRDICQTKLDFTNPATFQIIKAFSRLTQQTIADPFLNTLARNPNSIYAHIIDHYLDAVHKPTPKNLYETLISNSQLTNQTNVMILPRRETPIDREKEVGRWKVIEKELKERGLPVMGRVDEDRVRLLHKGSA